MILGALLDAGVDPAVFDRTIAALGLTQQVRVEPEAVSRGPISATAVNVVAADQVQERSLADIECIVGAAELDEAVAGHAVGIFRRLARAEAAVHGVDVADVHFHEVGALDCIVDVVCACAGLAALGVGRVWVSELPLGTGTVECRHGTLPLPAPATERLCAEAGAPVRGTGIRAELLTPTGAAILTTLAAGWGPAPPMRLERSGYGAGGRDLGGLPNVLRLMLGRPADEGADTAVVIEASLDDLQPELVAAAASQLLAEGALDVHVSPVLMKKSRPGVVLSVLCEPADEEVFARRLFETTSTFGVRAYTVRRRRLERLITTVDTPHGPVDVKCALAAGVVVTATPEYESAVRLARQAEAELRRVYGDAAAAASRLVGMPAEHIRK